MSRPPRSSFTLIAALVTAAACGGGDGGDPGSGGGGGPTAPSIVTNPLDAAAKVGATATFEVAAAGTPPLSYQWSRGGSAIPGATDARLTTVPATFADDGAAYQVVVKNAQGDVASRPAVLRVTGDPPAIVAGLADTTVVDGDAAAFAIQVTGSPPLGYAWYRGGVLVGSAQAATYRTPSLALADDGTVFDVVVSNPAGHVTARAVAHVTGRRPFIVAEPDDVVAVSGDPVTFQVAEGGTPTISVQWYYGETPMVGRVGEVLTFVAFTGDDGAKLHAVATNTWGTARSRDALLRVTPQ